MARRRTRPSPSTVRKKALAGLAATTLAHAADYDASTGRYTGQRAESDPWMTSLMDSGRKFWASRGVQLPETIGLDIADDLSGDDTAEGERVMGRAWNSQMQGGARVALDADTVRGELRRARNPKVSTADRRASLKLVASALLHEMGHTGDVAHTEGDDGFMGANGANGVVPQETAKVIRRLVPRPKPRRPGRGAG
jgi:hypothetical protein